MSRKWEKVEGWYVTVAYICAQTTDLSAICYPGCHMSSEVHMNGGVKAGSSLSIVPSLGSLVVHGQRFTSLSMTFACSCL